MMNRIVCLLALMWACAVNADKPLVNDRIVFDWHNFLSGCSTWNLADWNRWTDDAQKLGYNAIMVHAYGNNPMVSFTFNGKTKPVGYLSTTIRGRDWSTMHVNDVRRLFGGEVFDKAAFGADAALGPEEKRADAARQLMQGVFAHAGERGMNVFFADDVDTGSANPQELILTLPESARFAVQAKAGGMTGVSGEGDRRFWLANPDTTEGYQYYKAEVAALMADYPQITCLVVWFRNGGTPWMDLKVTEMPAPWQKEYNAVIAQKPEVAKLWHSQNMFAIGKIARAFQRALKELGRDRVRLATGSWHFSFLPSADLFFPPGIPFIGLDYAVLHDKSDLSTTEQRQKLAEVGAHRPLIPVIWAHHDDGAYIGRPFTPFPNFYTKLTEARASGFGVIHWTTRPLDLFFTSHIRQVFGDTKDEPLRMTCEKIGGSVMGEYLYRWITEAPRFARETSDRFIDRPLTNITAIVKGCRQRQALLEKCGAGLQPATPTHNNEQVANLLHIDYFRGLEQFIAAFHETHDFFQRSQAALKSNDIALARQLITQCHPEPVIEQFAKFSSIGGITRGEQGLVVALNARWLSHIVRHRQMLGLEPVRYKFGPTQHDPLAQSPGRYTFYFTSDHHLWQTLGTKETGAEVFGAPDVGEICSSGIETDKPLVLKLQPILAPSALPAGRYWLRLLAADPSSTAAGQRVFEVQVKVAGAAGGPVRYSFAPTRAKFVRLLCHGNSANDWNSIVEIVSPALVGEASASASVKGCEAPYAIDGRANTRWAARGDNVWIQFPLKPDSALEQLDVTWFSGGQRQYRVEFLVSDEGNNWRKIAAKSGSVSEPVNDRVDVFARAGGAKRPVELVYPINLAVPGVVELRLMPVTGKALLCGAVLEPTE